MDNFENTSSDQVEKNIIEEVKKEAKRLQEIIESTGQRNDEKRYIRGNIETIPTDEGFDVRSWGESVSLLYDSQNKIFRIKGVDTFFSNEDFFEKEIKKEERTLKELFSRKKRKDKKSKMKEKMSLSGRMIAFANILNYIKWHAKNLIRSRESEFFSFTFSEQEKETFRVHTGMVYRFVDGKNVLVKTYLGNEEGKRKGVNKIPNSFLFYCPKQNQRQAVLDYLNSLVAEWRDSVKWESQSEKDSLPKR